MLERVLSIATYALPLALLFTGCGGASCPEGFEKTDGRCLPADGGPDARTGDAAPGDAAPGDARPEDAADDSCVATTFYRDDDGDGFGLEGDTMASCESPEGYAAEAGDCDDSDDAVHPDAEEACNGLDDDCDETLDEGLASSTFHRDADGDGFGTPDESLDACAAPEGWVDNDTDCDDGDAALNPGAEETCNGVDDDCDGVADEGLQGLLGAAQALTTGGGASGTNWVGFEPVGDAYLAGWTADDGDAQYAVVEADGGFATPGVQAIGDGLGTEANARFAVVDDSRAVAVWQKNTGGTTDDVLARVLHLDGSAPGPITDVSTSADYLAGVAMVGDAVVVVWSESGTLWAEVLSADLGSLTTRESLDLAAPAAPHVDLVGVPADTPYGLLVFAGDCDAGSKAACVAKLRISDATIRGDVTKVDDARFEVFGTAASVATGPDGDPRVGVVATDRMSFNGEAELVRIRPGALDDPITVEERFELGPESGLEPLAAASSGASGWLDAVYTGGDMLHWAPVPTQGTDAAATARFASNVDFEPVATARLSGSDAAILFMRSDAGDADLWMQRLGCE